MTENDQISNTNTYFKQLKEKMTEKTNTTEKNPPKENISNQNQKNEEIKNKESELFKQKEEILKKLEKTEELPFDQEKRNNDLVKKNNKKSSLDKLKEMTEINQKKTEQNDKKINTEEKEETVNEKISEEKIEINSNQETMIKSNEKESKIETKTNPFFEPRKNDQKDLEWLKREIIEEPNQGDFENKENDLLKWPRTNKIKKEPEEKGEINKEESESVFKEERDLDEVKMENLNEKIILTNENFKTPIDEIFELIESYKKVDLDELSKYTKLDYQLIEKIAKAFEEEGIIELDYPTSLNKKPTIILKKAVPARLTKKPEGKVLSLIHI